MPHREPVHSDTAIQPLQTVHQQQLEQHQQGSMQPEELGAREHPVLPRTGAGEQRLDDHHVSDDEYCITRRAASRGSAVRLGAVLLAAAMDTSYPKRPRCTRGS